LCIGRGRSVWITSLTQCPLPETVLGIVNNVPATSPVGDVTGKNINCWGLKKISGVDPFTIDQTDITEGSDFEYGRIFYQYFNAKFTINTPSIIYQNKRPFNPMEEKGYDVIVMHPATTYQHNGPTWLSLDGERKATLIQPTEKMLFFVQAYYENESSTELQNYLVPADQTYLTNREGY